MKVAIMTIAYNEQETIRAVLRNWDLPHYIFLCEKPWHSKDVSDNTEMICKEFGANIVKADWQGETAMRNWALGYLYDYDYVLIVDADELYTEEDKKKILDSLNGETCYRADNVATYWKTTDYVIDPPDTHKPIIAVNAKRMTFKECRIPHTDYQPVIKVTMHHLSYCKSRNKIYEKMKQFEHHNLVKESWFNDKWLNWTPDTEFIHPYNKKNHKAIYKPLPEELKKLL